MYKITIKLSELRDVVTRGRMFAGKSKAMPVLDNVCITTKGERIRIESNDCENYVRSYGLCESTSEVSFCVNANELSSYISLLDDEYITMEYDCQKRNLIITHNNGKIKLPTTNAEEFPHTNPIKSDSKIVFPGKVLAGWLATAGDFAMKSDLGGKLECVNIYANQEYIGVCGGDHHHIFDARIKNTFNAPEFSILIPKTSAMAISRVCASFDDVTIMQDDDAILVRTENTIIYSKLMCGKYPDVSRLFSQKGSCCVKVDKTALLNAVKRIGSQTMQDDSAIHLRCTGSSFELLYDVTAEYDKFLSENILCEGDCLDDAIVNVRLLRNILDKFNGDRVVLYYDRIEGRPFLFENKQDTTSEQFLLATMIK